jgi:hypothetical protein
MYTLIGASSLCYPLYILTVHVQALPGWQYVSCVLVMSVLVTTACCCLKNTHHLSACHPAGLLALKSVMTGAATCDIASKYSGWGDTTKSPCHEIDPNCKLCPWQMPYQTCGSQIASNATGPPSYYCNAYGVACTDDRVTAVNMSNVGLMLSQLPAGMSQLTMLRELGGCS